MNLRPLRTPLLLLTAVLLFPGNSGAQQPCPHHQQHYKQPPAPQSAELTIAKIYYAQGDWKDAETHFLAAAAIPKSRLEALAGIKEAHMRQDQSQSAAFEAASAYEEEHDWAKAEDLYRSIAENATYQDTLRKDSLARLSVVLRKQALSGEADEAWEWIKRILEWLGLSAGILLIVFSVGAILKTRRCVVLHDFATPTDEDGRWIAMEFEHARERLLNPALSEAGPFPPILAKDLFRFEKETDDIENVEIGGVTLPLAALSKWLARPAVVIRGGFDAREPKAEAWATIETRKNDAQDFIAAGIRVDRISKSRSRSDIRTFAYTVLIRAAALI